MTLPKQKYKNKNVVVVKGWKQKIIYWFNDRLGAGVCEGFFMVVSSRKQRKFLIKIIHIYS